MPDSRGESAKKRIFTMRKNYLHLDFKGIAPLPHKWREYLELFKNK